MFCKIVIVFLALVLIVFIFSIVFNNIVSGLISIVQIVGLIVVLLIHLKKIKVKQFYIKYVIFSIVFLLLLANITSFKRDELHSKNEAKIPYSSKDFKYMNNNDVSRLLSEAGFTNISEDVIYDIFWGITPEGEVESVSVNGNTDYKKDELFKVDVPIVITYHMKEEDNPDKKTDNNTKEELASKQEENSNKKQIDEKETEEKTTVEKTTEEKITEEKKESIYEYAYVREYPEYMMCYLIDTDAKECIIFMSTDGYGYYGQYTGDISSEIIVDYLLEGYKDTITFQAGEGSNADISVGDDSEIFEFKRVPVDSVEKYLKTIHKDD